MDIGTLIIGFAAGAAVAYYFRAGLEKAVATVIGWFKKTS